MSCCDKNEGVEIHPSYKIKSNKAQCLRCGDIVESKTRHDFVWCRCRSLAVDGGQDYLKRSFVDAAWQEMSEFEEEG